MSRNKKKLRDRSQEEQVVKKHVVLPDVEVKKIKEPRPICSICGEPIESIIEAIAEADNSYSHFDCVIKTLNEKYHVQEPDKLSYIGHGNFAIFTPDEEGKFKIKERINYESNESYASMIKFVEEHKE